MVAKKGIKSGKGKRAERKDESGSGKKGSRIFWLQRVVSENDRCTCQRANGNCATEVKTQERKTTEGQKG